MFVRNCEQLLDHGCVELRRLILDVVEYALAAADPYYAVSQLISLDDRRLFIGDSSCDLRQTGSIRVLGAGKATLRIAQALEEVLGPRIKQGLISVKRGQNHNLRYISVIEAAHPLPDQSSYLAAREAIALAERAEAGDLMITAITGGSSSLFCYPANGITLQEKRQAHELLLTCGANILEINTVRKHLSRIKGGLLAQAALPAELINLTVSDVSGDPLDYIAGPVVPDTSHLSQAIEILDRYELWDRLAPSVRAHLSRGPQVETPKRLDETLVHTFVLVRSSAACDAANARAEELGISPLVLSTSFEGESGEAGAWLGAIVREIMERQRPVAPPCMLILSGENTVTVPGGGGAGGPSQELAVSLAMRIDGLPQVVAACIDTDGTDGPTRFAGALVDSFTAARARERGFDPDEALRTHHTTHLLEATGDVVHTGATGTNVADLIVLIVGH